VDVEDELCEDDEEELEDDESPSAMVGGSLTVTVALSD